MLRILDRGALTLCRLLMLAIVVMATAACTPGPGLEALRSEPLRTAPRDTATFTVPLEDHGPDGLAQGGMLAGNLAVLADRADGPFEVTLHSVGPLGVPLKLRSVDEERTGVWQEDRLIADVRPVTAAPTAPAPVDLATARRGTGSRHRLRCVGVVPAPTVHEESDVPASNRSRPPAPGYVTD